MIERVYTPRQHALFHLYGEQVAVVAVVARKRRRYLDQFEAEWAGSRRLWSDAGWLTLCEEQGEQSRIKEDIATRLMGELGCKRYGIPIRWGEWKQRGGDAEYEKLEASGQVPDLPDFSVDPDVAKPPSLTKPTDSHKMGQDPGDTPCNKQGTGGHWFSIETHDMESPCYAVNLDDLVQEAFRLA